MTSPDFGAPVVEPVPPPQEVVSPTVEKREPVPAVVESTPKRGAPPNAPTKREGGAPAQGKGKMIAAVATLGAALLLAAAAIKVLFFSDKSKAVEGRAQVTQSLSPDERRDNLYRNRGWVPEAEETLQNFLNAKTNDERAKWTIRGSVNEAEMAAVYEKFEEDNFRTPVSIFSPCLSAMSIPSGGFF